MKSFAEVKIEPKILASKSINLVARTRLNQSRSLEFEKSVAMLDLEKLEFYDFDKDGIQYNIDNRDAALSLDSLII